jgi:hypothetical protein
MTTPEIICRELVIERIAKKFIRSGGTREEWLEAFDSADETATAEHEFDSIYPEGELH